jgi:ABC-type transporter Mla MlaB component
MLRITVHDNPPSLTLQLEGKLAGSSIGEVEKSWHSARARHPDSSFCVDLTSVTHIDAAGKACLAAFYQQGAEFIAADCLTKAIVAEISQSPPPECEPSKQAGKNYT